MSVDPRVLVIVPTYNERDNLPRVVPQILAAGRRLPRPGRRRQLPGRDR